MDKEEPPVSFYRNSSKIQEMDNEEMAYERDASPSTTKKQEKMDKEEPIVDLEHDGSSSSSDIEMTNSRCKLTGKALQYFDRFIKLFENKKLRKTFTMMVNFEEHTMTTQSIRNDDFFYSLRNEVSSLPTSGKSFLSDFLLTMKQYAENSVTFEVAPEKIMPQIILLTAEGTKKIKIIHILTIGVNLGKQFQKYSVYHQQLKICNAKIQGGSCLNKMDVVEVSKFFKKQISLLEFITKFEDIAHLFGHKALRVFLDEKYGESVTDEELDVLIILLNHVAKLDESIPKSDWRQPTNKQNPTHSKQKHTPVRREQESVRDKKSKKRLVKTQTKKSAKKKGKKVIEVTSVYSTLNSIMFEIKKLFQSIIGQQQGTDTSPFKKLSFFSQQSGEHTALLSKPPKPPKPPKPSTRQEKIFVTIFCLMLAIFVLCVISPQWVYPGCEYFSTCWACITSNSCVGGRKVNLNITDSEVPQYVKRLNNSFLFNGIINPALQLRMSRTYIFDVHSPGCPFWIEFAKDVNTGIGCFFADNNGVESGRINLHLPQTPSTISLIYKCFNSKTNFASLTGNINVIPIVNPPGEDTIVNMIMIIILVVMACFWNIWIHSKIFYASFGFLFTVSLTNIILVTQGFIPGGRFGISLGTGVFVAIAFHILAFVRLGIIKLVVGFFSGFILCFTIISVTPFYTVYPHSPVAIPILCCIIGILMGAISYKYEHSSVYVASILGSCFLSLVIDISWFYRAGHVVMDMLGQEVYLYGGASPPYGAWQHYILFLFCVVMIFLGPLVPYGLSAFLESMNVAMESEQELEVTIGDKDDVKSLENQ